VKVTVFHLSCQAERPSAALVVSRVSCSDVMPRREEVEALLARSA
jgi:hypothetical protein